MSCHCTFVNTVHNTEPGQYARRFGVGFTREYLEFRFASGGTSCPRCLGPFYVVSYYVKSLLGHTIRAFNYEQQINIDLFRKKT